MPRRSFLHLSAEQLEARDVPATAFALTQAGTSLLRFDTATPNTIQATLPITGVTVGDVLVGTDFRPANGVLYGVAANNANNTLTVYTIDLTGAATPVGGPVALPGTNTIAGATAWGVDVNPFADRIRVTNNLGSDVDNDGNANNLRLNPNDGTLVAVDPDLVYTGLPNGAADGPEVAVAYTNSQVGTQAGQTATTLFGIVSGGDLLVSHSTTPGFQTLTSVGPLGSPTSDLAGLDIFGPNNGATSTAVAILTDGALAHLFTVNLQTGTTTLVGLIGDGTQQLTDISVAPAPIPVVVSGTTDGKVQLLTPVGGQLTTGASVTAFANSTQNVRAGTADVNRDGVPDLVLVTGPGTPIRVTVLSGLDNAAVLVAPFDPFGGTTPFTGGGFIATGDFNNDGQDDFVVTPDQGGGPRVSIFSRNTDGTTTRLADFLGIDDANFRGGARAAAGDVNGDGRVDLVVGAGFLGGPRVAIFNGTTLTTTPTRLIGDFFAFPGTDAVTLRNGVFVTLSDITGDGFADLVFGGGPGGAPRVFILSGALVSANNVAGAQAAPVANFFVANNMTDRGGVRLSAADLDGDFRGDLVVGSGEGLAAKVRAYRGINFTTAGEPTVFQDLNLFNGAVLANGVFVG